MLLLSKMLFVGSKVAVQSKIFGLTFVGCVFFIVSVCAQTTTIPCFYTPKDIQIDGNLSDLVWQDIPWSTPFIDIRGEAFPKPEGATQVKFCWNKHYFFIAATLQDQHLWTTMTEDETELYRQDVFEVFIDPDADGLDYYELEINALGTTWDLALSRPYNQGGQANSAWNIDGLQKGIQLQGTINDATDLDQGWTLELAIPWDAFFDKKHCRKSFLKKQILAINFLRMDYDLDVVEGQYQQKTDGASFGVWKAQGTINMHLPQKWQPIRLVTRNWTDF